MLSIQSLKKTYSNGVRALDGVTLEVSNGLFGLLGPNGAGKSTLMRTIATLQPVDAGSINFNGIDVLGQPDRVRQVLGYLPQDFGVYPRISAVAMLDHLARLKGFTNAKERTELVEYQLQQTNLWDVRKKALKSYSGGMRQRFGVAQALIGDPKLVIVDEPTAGLDPEERQRFLNLLSGISKDVVVILSTHIVEDVSDLCPRTAIMANGRIRAEGTPTDMTAALDGKIWSKTVSKEASESIARQRTIVSSRLFGGEVMLDIFAESDPGDGFMPRRPNMAHVYFRALHADDTQKEAA